jgi:hypothetical protein
MQTLADAAVKVAFRRRVKQLRGDMLDGNVQFYNPPEVWTDKLLNITSLNGTLINLAHEERWN